MTLTREQLLLIFGVAIVVLSAYLHDLVFMAIGLVGITYVAWSHDRGLPV